jgi:hypothetical protein
VCVRSVELEKACRNDNQIESEQGREHQHAQLEGWRFASNRRSSIM